MRTLFQNARWQKDNLETPQTGLPGKQDNVRNVLTTNQVLKGEPKWLMILMRTKY